MFRRITLLIPLLIIVSLSGCIILPDRGWHDHGHRYYHDGPGYYYRR